MCAAAVFENDDLMASIAPLLVGTVVLEARHCDDHVRVTLPVLLGLTRRSRAACLRALHESGLLHLQAGPVGYTVLHHPDAMNASSSSPSSPPTLPFQWRVTLKSPVFDGIPMVAGFVHPLDKLWRCTRDACEEGRDVSLRAPIPSRVCVSSSKHSTIMAEFSDTLVFFVFDPDPDLGLESLRDEFEVCRSLEELFSVSIRPCFGILSRVTRAVQEYRRWSYVRGARRLGLEILPSPTGSTSCGVIPHESA